MVHFDERHDQKVDVGVGCILALADWFNAEPGHSIMHGLEQLELASEESWPRDEVGSLDEVGHLLAIDFGLRLGCS